MYIPASGNELSVGDLVRVPRVRGTISNLTPTGKAKTISPCRRYAKVVIEYGARACTVNYRISDLKVWVDGRKRRSINA
jgi:hypothetical protein